MMFKRKKPSDRQAVQQVIAGDREAYVVLVDRYLRQVHALAFAKTGNRADAEDIAQEAFVKGLEKLHRLHDQDKFGPWILAITRNAASNHTRAARAERVSLERLAHLSDRAHSPDMERRDIHAFLREGVMNLDEGPREVLLLHYFAGNSTREIAALLGIRRDAAKKRLQRAKEALSKNMWTEIGPAFETDQPTKEQVTKIMGIVAGVSLASQTAAAQGVAASGATGAAMVGGAFTIKKAAVLGMAVVVLSVAGVWMSEDTPQPARETNAPEPGGSFAESRDGSATGGIRAARSQAAVASSDEPYISAFEPRVTRGQWPLGRGSVRGMVTAKGFEVSGDVRVALYKIGWTEYEVSVDDPLRKEVALGKGASFSFHELPMGRYAALAFGSGVVGEQRPILSGARPESVITIELVPAGRISGAVRDEAGSALTDVTVYLGGYQEEGDHWHRASQGAALFSRVEVDTDGRYAIDYVAQSDEGGGTLYRLIATAPGFAPKRSELVSVGAEDVDFVLTRGGGVSGRVVHADSGESVSGVSLWVESEDALGGRRATSDEDGRFQIAGLAPGEHTLDVVDDKMVAVGDARAFSVSEVEVTEGVRIPVAYGGTISGRMYDADTNEGIVDHRINLSLADANGFGAVITSTDSDGRFQFGSLKAGSYMIDARRVYGYAEERRAGRNTRLVNVGFNQETRGIDFPVTRGPYLSGIVIDHNGEPLDRVRLSVGAQTTGAQQSAETRPDGSFIAAGLVSGMAYHIRARKEGHGGAVAGPVVVGEEGFDEVRIVMQPPGRIEGAVVRPNGNPVARVRVSATDHETGGNQTADPSDEYGRFITEGLGKGTYHFGLSKPQHPSDAGASFLIIGSKDHPVIELAARETVTDILLIYEIGGEFTIAGSVTDTNGVPLNHIQVSADGPQGSFAEVLTDVDGRFELVDMREGPHTLNARSSKYTDQRVTGVQAGERGVAVVIRGRGSVEGRVIDDDTGQPIKRFSIGRIVFMKELGTISGRGNFQPVHDSGGRFELVDVEEGEVTVVARAEGYSEGRGDVVQVVENQVSSGVTVALRRGGRITGTVVDISGEPIRCAMIFVGSFPQERDRARRVATQTDDDGTFVLDSLPADSTFIYAYHPDFAPGASAADLGSEYEANIEIVLGAGAAIEGSLKFAGEPLAEQWVFLFVYSLGDRSYHIQAQSDSNGLFSFDGLSDGEATLNVIYRISAAYRRDRQVTIPLAKGNTITVDIDFPAGTASIEGRVLEGEGAPVEVDVHCEIPTGVQGETDTIYVQSDENGYYVLDGLPGGSMQLSINFGGKWHLKTVEVGEGERVLQDIVLTE